MSSECWISIQVGMLRVNQWDGEYVLYNISSGDTHLLDEIGISILEFLQDSKATSDDIYEFLQKQKRADISYEQLRELLDGMSRINLIEKVS